MVVAVKVVVVGLFWWLCSGGGRGGTGNTHIDAGPPSR